MVQHSSPRVGITKGKWEREGLRITQLGSGIIAICPTPQEGGVFECSANSHMIVAVVNACQKVNPDNPQAVAESIEKMHEALKLYQAHQKGTRGHYCWECAEVIKQALQSAEQKGAS